jgi:methyltransferase-like protein/SAM-dependent methyltransferase
MADATQPTPTTYDLVPYPRLAFAHTHPSHLAALAVLLGMTPARRHCRVLEIGCASGSNLIPMALEMPESEFVGVDASLRQVAEGQADIAALGLRNVTLLPMDLAAIDASFGLFDYIIVHGVFSWVPAPLRDKILTICQQNLAPAGLAYISYNVYPGWHNRIGLREMLLFHTRHISDPAAKAREALDFLRFMTDALPEKESVHGAVLHAHYALLREGVSDERASLEPYLLHEYLAEENTPLYFHQFAGMATAHGLQYLCDADFWSDSPARFAPAVVQKLREVVQTQTDLHQYMDFLRDRAFRRTVLCHAEVTLDRRLTGDRLFSLYVASGAVPETEDFDIAAKSPVRFASRNGNAILTIDHPLSKAALRCLQQSWPRRLAFDELVVQAQALLQAQAPRPIAGAVAESDRELLGVNLLRAFVHSPQLAEIAALPSAFAAAGDYPLATAWVRRQAQSSARITTLRHESAELKPAEHFLLHLLDGTRNRAALLAALQDAISSGEVALPAQDATSAPRVTATAADLDELLSNLAFYALLVD